MKRISQGVTVSQEVCPITAGDFTLVTFRVSENAVFPGFTLPGNAAT